MGALMVAGYGHARQQGMTLIELLIAPGMMLEFHFTTADAEPSTAGRILAVIEMDSALAELQ